MQIDIIDRHGGLEPAAREGLRRHVQRRFAALTGRVRHVMLRLSDLNGPRGGLDTRCVITIEPRQGSSHTFVADAATILQATRDALRRARHSLQREADRALAPRHRRLAPIRVRSA